MMLRACQITILERGPLNQEGTGACIAEKFN
jgi:hypothetical protein